MKITNLKARVIKATGNKDTVEVVLTADTKQVTASVPAGISTGKHEVPYADPQEACMQITEVILPKILGWDTKMQLEVDALLNTLDVGANARLAVSVAVCKAGDNLYKTGITKKPILLLLCFEGGRHGSGILDMQ